MRILTSSPSPARPPHSPSPVSISLDISLYPLTPEYKAPILGFIERLRGYEGFEVMSNPLSTQLYGDFEAIWGALGTELPRAFGAEFASVAVMKVVSVDVLG